MLRAIRRNGIAPLALLLVMAGSVPESVFALMHDDGRDPCEPTLVLHDESAHRFGARPGQTPEPEHCAICHWLQSLRTVQSGARIVVPNVESRPIATVAVQTTGQSSCGRLSARAPPLV